MPRNLTYDNRNACCVPYDSPAATDPQNRKAECPMTYEEKRDWLFRYKDSLRREEELAQEVERLHSEACRITPLLSGIPGAAVDGEKLPRAVEQIVEAQDRLQTQINQCGAIRRQVVAAIEQIADPRDHEILRRRYLLGQKWEEISVEMCLEYRWVTRRHHKAIDAMILTPESPT